MTFETKTSFELIDADLTIIPFPLKHAESYKAAGHVVQLGTLGSCLTTAQAELVLAGVDHFLDLGAKGVQVAYFRSLMGATAAKRLGLAPRFGPLDRTSVHVDGRDNSDEEPGAQVVHIIRGYSRDHRPDLNHVLVELMVEHQAGIPLLMQPLSGHSSEAQDVGEAVCALDIAANLQQLAQTPMQWIPVCQQP